MFNFTDVIVGLLIVFYAVIGWRKGFVKSLLTPVSCVVCFALAWVYFKKTHDVLVSFGISLLGPFVIKLVASLVMSLGNQASKEKQGPGPGSRGLGSAVSLTWGLMMTVLGMTVLVLSPITSGPILTVKDNNARSV